jgi:hypothetical protein
LNQFDNNAANDDLQSPTGIFSFLNFASVPKSDQIA